MTEVRIGGIDNLSAIDFFAYLPRDAIHFLQNPLTRMGCKKSNNRRGDPCGRPNIANIFCDCFIQSRHMIAVTLTKTFSQAI